MVASVVFEVDDDLLNMSNNVCFCPKGGPVVKKFEIYQFSKIVEDIVHWVI